MKPSIAAKKIPILLTLLALVLLAGGGAWFYRAYQTARNRLIETKKTEVAALIRGRASTELSAQIFADATSDASQAAFRDFFARIQSPQVVRMKVWNEQQVVLWSNLPEIIGQKFSDNDEVKEAHEGKVVLAIEEQKAEHVSERQYASLAEIYVPLMPPSGGEAFGVVEIYEPANLIDGPAADEVRRAAVPAGAVTAAALALAAGFAFRARGRKRDAHPSGRPPQENPS